MAVNSPLPVASELKPVNGIDIGFAEAGIKKPNRKDVLLMTLAEAPPSPACSPRTASAPRRSR